MDPREVIILSSDDEMSFKSDEILSNESNGRSRAFFDPDEPSLDSDDLVEGMDPSLRVLSIISVVMIIKNVNPPLCRRHGCNIALRRRWNQGCRLPDNESHPRSRRGNLCRLGFGEDARGSTQSSDQANK